MTKLRFTTTKVVCLDYKKVYESISLASKLTGCCYRSITKCCRGQLKGCYSYLGRKLRWMYLEDYIKIHGEQAYLELHSTSSDFY